jgi:type VI secretion system secreted protein Hcp
MLRTPTKSGGTIGEDSMRVRSGLLAAVMSAAFAISAIPSAVLAAVDAYLNIDGIKGESQDDNHKGWIEISSFSWGASNSASIGSASSGAGAGKVSMQDIHITKTVDSASPLLMRACASGKHFPTVMLSVRKAGGGATVDYVLTDAMITKVDAGGGGTDRPVETITIAFAKMQTQSSNPVESRPVMAPMGGMRRPGG